MEKAGEEKYDVVVSRIVPPNLVKRRVVSSDRKLASGSSYDLISSLLAGLRKMSTRGGSSSLAALLFLPPGLTQGFVT